MQRDEYQSRYSERDPEIDPVNQHCLTLRCPTIEPEHEFHIPVEHTDQWGRVAYLPRDIEYPEEEFVRRTLQFESRYLPVTTPRARLVENSINNGVRAVRFDGP